MQLQSKNRCTIIKEKYFRNNAIKWQMQQNKRKILYKQTQSENRCIKMRIGIYTKQIGNCLDNLVLANRYLNSWKPYQNRIVKKSHISHKVSQECHIRFYNQSHKLGKEGHVNFHNHTLTHVNGTVIIIDLKSQRDQKYGEKLKQTNTTNFPSVVTHLPRQRIVRKVFQSFFLSPNPNGGLGHKTRGLS